MKLRGPKNRPHGGSAFDPPPLDELGTWEKAKPFLPPEPDPPSIEELRSNAVAKMKADRQRPKDFNPNTMVLPEARTYYAQLWQAEGRAIAAAVAAENSNARVSPRHHRPRGAGRGRGSRVRTRHR